MNQTESLSIADLRRAVKEKVAADAVGLSVHTLRKDRQGPRRIPFMKIGGAVRYDLERVRQALAAMEQGGPEARPDRRSAAPA